VFLGQIGEVDDVLQAIADGAAVATTVSVATPSELVKLQRSLLVDGLQNLCDQAPAAVRDTDAGGRRRRQRRKLLFSIQRFRMLSRVGSRRTHELH
jgi:hypothetical protein